MRKPKALRIPLHTCCSFCFILGDAKYSSFPGKDAYSKIRERSSTAKLMGMCLAGWVMLMMLYLLLYQGGQRKNIGITFGILLFFCVAAYIANCLLDYNYMFLMAGDGTPYDILYNLVGGHKVIYPVSVVALFILYIGIYYGICQLVRNKKRAKAAL